ncbi:MAG: protein kinase domain-containing protein [Gemmatimonadaceae bacterium]
MSDPTHDADFIALQAALAGEFFLERELGRGGMGVVYLARESVLERPVAIKVLPPAMAARPELRERFLREARTAANLSHPNIVPVFRAEVLGGFVFFAMAHVDGETLAQRVRARGPLPPHEAARMVREVSWALAYAHARGVVHRDVKPDNIMVERETGRWMVTDFGIAQVAAAAPITDEGLVMGTAHFMSPEQAAGESLDGRSDLYSLGVVAFLATTGRLPFEAPTAAAVLAQHLTALPPSCGALAPALPRTLANAIDRCLAKDPAARFPNGEALAEAVTRSGAEAPRLPAPLRVWLTKRDVFIPAYVVCWLFALSYLTRLNPWGLVLAGIPVLFHGAFLIYHTRRVLGAGYGLDDIRRALRQYTEQRREELLFDVDRRPPVLARVVRALTYACVLGLVGIAVLTIVSPERVVANTKRYLQVASLLCTGFGVGGVIGLAYPGRRIRSEHWFSRLRGRFWEGRGGAMMVRLAAWRLRRGSGDALVHRPTELAIGGAAGALFESLPKTVRKRLGDVPAVIGVLEEQARIARARVYDTEALLADAVAFDVPGDADDRHRHRVVEDMRGARDAAAARLTTVLAALEGIRLDLLRLKAGAAGPESITATLDAARRFGEDVDRAVEASAQVAAIVSSPSPPSARRAGRPA